MVLAGGDGVRLRPLTRLICGDDRPKQFCPIVGSESVRELWLAPGVAASKASAIRLSNRGRRWHRLANNVQLS